MCNLLSFSHLLIKLYNLLLSFSFVSIIHILDPNTDFDTLWKQTINELHEDNIRKEITRFIRERRQQVVNSFKKNKDFCFKCILIILHNYHHWLTPQDKDNKKEKQRKRNCNLFYVFLKQPKHQLYYFPFLDYPHYITKRKVI